ncbi:uncharacterized protein LOC124269426 [Haliotis rubra]|uniref:uncharacterized protein LOC124269426 n=1 Tax=Haliotis rubra TaxID=36100 RepID=UPI001EE632EA|nr:uncharacterized protein LOC124269426 [Haliotis rubra]
MRSPVQSTAANNILKKASQLLIQERIRHHRKTKAIALNTIANQQEQLQTILSPDNYNTLRQLQNQSNHNLDDATKKTHITKLNSLVPNGPITKRQPRDDYLNKINLSSRTLSDEDRAVLSKGLNFAPSPRQHNDTFIANIEKGLQQFAPGGKVDYLRHQIANILVKKNNTNAKIKDNLSKANKAALKQLQSDPAITIAPADKGRATVIMDTTAFTTLTNNILNDPATYKQLKKDPTNSLQRDHKAHLKELRDNNEIGPTLHKQLTVPHPRPPYARATIKIHKDPIKARLLVCSRNTVNYNTAQHIARLFAPLGKSAKSFVSDSAEFCTKISAITQPGKLISYDVVDLFTNVPREEALTIIRKRLQDLHPDLDTHLSIDSIIRLINSCISSTYFTWSDKIYQQTNGLPMDSPLSPIITEIYMTELEDKALLTSIIAPICWYRKVDDTFVVLNPNDNPEHLLNHMNSQHPRMRFTKEEESDNKLPFLDVLVKKEDNKLSTTVYRKPTNTFTLSPTTRYRLRNASYPLSPGELRTSALESELNHIRHVFVHYNQYPQKLVNNIITTTLNPRDKPPRRQSAPFVISIPYVPAVSHQIRRLLQQQPSIDVLFQKGKSIQNLLQATGCDASQGIQAETTVFTYFLLCYNVTE